MDRRARFWRAALFALVLPVLTGCPSSGVGEGETPPVQQRLEGFAGSGFAGYGMVAVTGVHGRQSAFPIDGSDQYLLDLRQVDGPYLLRAEVAGKVLHSMASEPGHTNVTLLTELAVADLFGASPPAVFDAQEAGDSPQDLSLVSPESIAGAEQRVRALLKRRLSLVPPDALDSFFSTSARLDAGDPTTAFQRTLESRIAVSMQMAATDFVQLVVQRRRACRVQALALSAPEGEDPFCASARSVDTDLNDATITRHRFAEPFGDELVLRLRGDELLDVNLTRHDGRQARCDGAACVGVTIGSPSADGERTLQLEGTTLSGNAGPAIARGTLQSGPPGALTGGCPGDEITLMASDGSVASHCIGRRSVTPRLGRFEHGLLSMNDPRFVLDLILDGDRAVWAMVGNDPMFAGNTPYFQRARCMNAECAGIVVSRPDADGRRRVQFNQVVLLRTDTDGQLIPGETLLLQGSVLTGIPRPVAPPQPCRRVDGSPGPVLRVVADGGAEMRVCDSLGGAAPVTEHDDDGDGVVEALSFFHQGTPSDAAAAVLTFSIDHYRPDDGSVALMGVADLWNNFGGLHVGATGVAGCTAGGCDTTGLVFEGDPGVRTVRVQGLALPETFPNGAPTGRTLRLWIETP